MGKQYKIRTTFENIFDIDNYDVDENDWDAWIEIAQAQGSYLVDWQIFDHGFEEKDGRILKLAEGVDKW